MITQRYYVYELINPKTNLPFYVGKGSGNRAQSHIDENKKNRNTDNPYKDHTIRKLLKENLEPIIKYVYYSDSEQIAYAYETKLIAYYGRKRFDVDGILTNLCKDNNPPNQKGMYSDERKKLYSNRMIGNTFSKGRTQTKEEKIKRGKSLKAAYDSGKRVVTDAMREATRRTHLNKIVSKETRIKQSIRAKKAHAWRKGKTNEEIFGKDLAAEIKKKKANHLAPNRKEIIVDGVKYTSIRAASIELGISEYKAKQRAINDNKEI